MLPFTFFIRFFFKALNQILAFLSPNHSFMHVQYDTVVVKYKQPQAKCWYYRTCRCIIRVLRSGVTFCLILYDISHQNTPPPLPPPPWLRPDTSSINRSRQQVYQLAVQMKQCKEKRGISLGWLVLRHDEVNQLWLAHFPGAIVDSPLATININKPQNQPRVGLCFPPRHTRYNI